MRGALGPRLGLSLVCALWAACSSGGGGGGGGDTVSFAGTVLGPSGTGLPGVVVEVQSSAGSAQATTDASGNFIVPRPPKGMVLLHVDGSGAPGGTFASLELAVVVGGGATNLAQPIVLPDLSAGTTVDVAVDGSGMTSGAAMVTAPDGTVLDIPDMTTILLDGQVPGGPVPVNVTPVPAINVPMPLPGNQDPGAFVTIQPPNASFSPALGITLPNTRGLPAGTMVDIWSFDHQDGAWVNRSQQTGNQGVVSQDELTITASAVITEGGWHAGSLPVDPECATTIAGQVFGLGTTTPLRDVLISLSTGQFARTDAQGRFSIASVPAYDAGALPNCDPIDLDLRAIAPVSFGAMTVEMTIAAGLIVPGGTTNLAPFDIPVSSTGSLVGTVSDSGQRVQGTVSITGTAMLDVDTDAWGTFFVSNLDPGPYTATFPFKSGDVSEDFTITANQTSFVTLSAGTPGGGGGAVNVQVLDFNSGSPDPVDGACVTLVGASGGPQFATSGSDGIAAFTSAPAGPYTVTAQLEVVFTLGGTARLATTLVGVQASGSPGLIVLPLFDDGDVGQPVVVDAMIEGSALNPPQSTDLDFQIATESDGGFQIEGSLFSDAFTADVPSNVPLDAAVTARDDLDGTIQSAVFAPGLTVGSGQTLMTDFDFANACPFDQAVSVTYDGAPTGGFAFADLELNAAGNLYWSFSDGQSLPTAFDWPDLSNVKLSGFDAWFETGIEDFAPTFAESSCSIPLGHTTRTKLQVAFLGYPTIQAPADQATFKTYGTGNTVQFTLGAGNGTTTGFNSVTFFGESFDSETVLFWDILMPAATTAVTLPAVFASKPMFPDGFYVVDASATRFDYPGFDFATFFDADLPTSVAAVMTMEICEAGVGHFFIVGTSPSAPSSAPLVERSRATRRFRP